MPFVTAPDLIEQSDFTRGWAPDPEPVNMEPEFLIDVKNLVPDPISGSLETRKGFRRIREEITGGGTHYVQQVYSMHAFVSGTRHEYLIAIVSTGTAAANNVRLYSVRLSTGTVTRMDTAGRTWSNPTEHHWGMSIQGIWYGGVRGESMYSWDPSGPTWDPDASVKAATVWKTWVTDTENDAGLNTSNEWPKDYAFNGKERVKKGSDYYQARKSIRFDTWDAGTHYDKGDKVSRKVDWGSNEYWVSWKAEQAHDADTANRPGDGTGTWQPYWKKVKLESPTNDDDETGGDWDDVPIAAKTSVAEWHAGRLWLRYDGSGQRDRIQFSAPMKNAHGQKIATQEFEPTDFVPGNDANGPGGGWLNINDGQFTGVVTAMRSYGTYLLIWKRQSLWALSGQSEATFTLRNVVRGIGCASPKSVTEHNGLVYFISEDGLYVTDGTTAEPVEGLDAVRVWLTDRIGDLFTAGGNTNVTDMPKCWSYGPYIWVSLCVSGDPVTLAYHPETASFWYTNLPVNDVSLLPVARDQRMFFAADPSYGSGDLIYEYESTTSADADDTGAADYAAVDIAWHVRTGWWPFGLARAERRVRRTWAVVKGVAQTFTLDAYRNWVESAAETKAIVSTTTTPQHIEGEWMADSHAVSFKLSGTKGAAVVHGIAVDTEPRRTRYHT